MRYVRWTGLLWACVLSCSQRPPDDVSYQSALGSTAASSDQSLDAVRRELVAPIWSGDDDRGSLIAPLYRGAAVAIEDFVFVPPDHDCTDTRATLRHRLGQPQEPGPLPDQVQEGAGPPVGAPDGGRRLLHQPRPQSPASFDDGGFRFWTILTAPTGLTKKFYYDGTTLQFVGQRVRLPERSAGDRVPDRHPRLHAVRQQALLRQRRRDDVPRVHRPVRPRDGGGRNFSLAYTSFIPLDLCESNPVQVTLGQLRPWASPWQPPSLAPTWRDVLRGGAAFDTTVDENQTVPGDVRLRALRLQRHRVHRERRRAAGRDPQRLGGSPLVADPAGGARRCGPSSAATGSGANRSWSSRT